MVLISLLAVEHRPYHLEKLLSAFERKQRQNPAYSLRAYARHLGIQAPSLSAILKSKRNIPLKRSQALARRLSLSPVESQRFVASVQSSRKLSAVGSETNRRTLLSDEAHYRVISEWEHYAILTLLDVRMFEASPESIARRLGISHFRAERCLENLEQASLIRKRRGKWAKCQPSVQTTEDISSQALVESHREGLELAKRQLESIPVDLRDYSSVTVTFSPEKMTEMKKLIRRFRRQVARVAETPDAAEVYQMNLQFFPLTQLISGKDPS